MLVSLIDEGYTTIEVSYKIFDRLDILKNYDKFILYAADVLRNVTIQYLLQEFNIAVSRAHHFPNLIMIELVYFQDNYIRKFYIHVQTKE